MGKDNQTSFSFVVVRLIVSLFAVLLLLNHSMAFEWANQFSGVSHLFATAIIYVLFFIGFIYLAFIGILLFLLVMTIALSIGGKTWDYVNE